VIPDYLCDACKAYHEEVQALLTIGGVAFEDDPRLVRGLDYYTLRRSSSCTTGRRQSAIRGGGPI